MVGIGEHFLQGQASLLQSPSSSKALDQPESTGAKTALLAREAVICGLCSLVAVDEGVVGKFLLNTVQGRQPARVRGPNEFDQGHQKQRCVECFAAIVLDEAFAFGIPPLLHNLFVDGIPLLYPATFFGRQSSLMGHSHRSLERYPAQYLRGYEGFALTSDLPHTFVWLLPVFAQPAQNRTQVVPDVIVQRGAVLVVQVSCIQYSTVEVELELVVCTVAQPYRSRVAVTGQMGELFLEDLCSSIYPVERLEHAVGVAADIPQPTHEIVRFLIKAKTDKRIQGICRIS